MSRYSRQILLKEIGDEGQRKLEQSSVLCVGAGGLGSALLPYLVSAGVGRIGIIDGDVVDESNLQRQVIYQESQVGLSKVFCAKTQLQKLNSKTVIEAYPEMLTAQNVEKLFQRFDVIVDGTDRFSAKYLINDAAVKWNKPVVFGSVTGFEGQLSVFDARHGPCYRCIYPEPAQSSVPNCNEAGVLGSVVGLIGTLQATECLKLLLSIRPLIGKVLSLDARDMSIFTHNIEKNTHCPVCSVEHDRILLSDSVEVCGSSLLDPDCLWVDVRTQEEWELGHVKGALHLPLSEIEANPVHAIEHLLKYQKGKAVIYCQSGRRSQSAIQFLNKNELPSRELVFMDLNGGIQAWPSLKSNWVSDTISS